MIYIVKKDLLLKACNLELLSTASDLNGAFDTKTFLERVSTKEFVILKEVKESECKK